MKADHLTEDQADRLILIIRDAMRKSGNPELLVIADLQEKTEKIIDGLMLHYQSEALAGKKNMPSPGEFLMSVSIYFLSQIERYHAALGRSPNSRKEMFESLLDLTRIGAGKAIGVLLAEANISVKELEDEILASEH